MGLLTEYRPADEGGGGRGGPGRRGHRPHGVSAWIMPPAQQRNSTNPFNARLRRKLVFVSVMVTTGSMLFSIYVLTLGCCTVVMAPGVVVDGGRSAALGYPSPAQQHASKLVLVAQDPREDETKYQRALEDMGGGGGGGDNPTNYSPFRRKTLLDLQGSESQPGSRRRPRNSGTNPDSSGPYTDRDYYEDTDLSRGDNNLNTDSLEYSQSHQRNERTQNSNNYGEQRGTGMLRTNRTASRRLPHALIIGVKKGGTRALLEYLRMHPDVRAPGPEAHFFDRNYDRGIEWYRRQMPPTIEGQVTMEKTPSYFVTKLAPPRIFNMSKNTKLVVVVRDPVTRAISDYTQALSKRNDIKTFEGMAFQDNSTGLVDTSWGAIKIGVYAKHLERWLQFFPLSQMHFVSGEKMIKDPAGEMAKVQDFLGIKRVITDKHFYFNTTKGFPCLKKPEGSGNPHCLGKTKGRPHPQIEEAVLQRLRDFFRPFNQKFYQMVGQDFGWS